MSKEIAMNTATEILKPLLASTLTLLIVMSAAPIGAQRFDASSLDDTDFFESLRKGGAEIERQADKFASDHSASSKLSHGHVRLATISENPGCIPKKQAKDYLSRFKIPLKDFGDLELCDNSKPLKMLFNAIWALESAQFSMQGELPFPSPSVLPPDYYAYLVNQKVRFAFDKDHKCPVRSPACVVSEALKYPDSSKYPNWWTVYLAPLFFSKEMPFITRLGSLIHETRHVGWEFKHTNCFEHEGYYYNQPGCDYPDSKGSYVAEMEFYQRVAKFGANFDPVLKSMARVYAEFGLENHITPPPLSAVKGALLVDSQDGHVVLFDGTNVIERPHMKIRNSVLINRSLGFDVLPRDANEKKWYLNPILNSPSGLSVDEMVLDPVQSYIKSPEPGSGYSDLIDFYNAPSVQFALYKDRVDVRGMFAGQWGNGPAEELSGSIEMTAGASASFISQDFCKQQAELETKIRINDPYSGVAGTGPWPVIKTSANEFYYMRIYIDYKNPKHPVVPILKKIECALPANVLSIVKVGKQNLMLTKDGEVISDQGAVVPYFSNRRFSLLKPAKIYPNLME